MAIEWEIHDVEPITWGGAEYIPTISADIPRYEGSYAVTPTSETQTLHTTEMLMVEDLTINPIPSNYGLITWDGSTLMVS